MDGWKERKKEGKDILKHHIHREGLNFFPGSLACKWQIMGLLSLQFNTDNLFISTLNISICPIVSVSPENHD